LERRNDQHCVVTKVSEQSSSKKRPFELRIVIGTQDHRLGSGIWRIWQAKNTDDIYIAPRSIAGQVKVSFHPSGYCYVGFPRQFADRLLREGHHVPPADRALAYSRELGHAHTLAYALALAGTAAVFARDVATACAYGNDCVALASEHGFAHWAAYGRILQGWADAQKGEATTGIARIRDGLAAAEATGTRLHTPLFLTLLAEALALAGKIAEALAALDDALAKAAVSGARGWNAEIHRLYGELTGRLPYPDPAKAEDSFRTALASAREQGTRGYELRSATSLARLWREHGRRAEARDLLAPLYGWFTEGFDTADLKDAKRLLDELA
jgi:predicted ATPase